MRFLLLTCLLWTGTSLLAQTYQPRTYATDQAVYPSSAYSLSTVYDTITYLQTPVGALCFTCNDCQVVAANTPFPVEWLGFTAERVEADTVRLRWEVWQEHSRGLFVIERRLAYEDTFRAVGRLHRPQDGWLTLSHRDSNRYEGLSYYRIRQHDHDGQSNLSEQRVVRGWSARQLLIYPNPCRELVHLRIPQSDHPQTWQIRLIDVRGRMVLLRRGQGALPATLPLTEVPAGAYVISLQVGSQRWQQTLLRRP